MARAAAGQDPVKLAELLGTTEFWERLKAEPAALAAEVCTVNVKQLDATLQMHAALRAWVNAAHEVARINEARAKWEDIKTRAQVKLQQRGIDPVTNKPRTVTVIEAEVELWPEVQQTTEKLFVQQEIRGALRAMADALEDRKDMLIQIASKQRKEMSEYQ